MGSERASVLGAGVRGDRAWRRGAGGDFGRRQGRTAVGDAGATILPAAAERGRDTAAAGSWLAAMVRDRLQEKNAVWEEKSLQSWGRACPLCDLGVGASPGERERPWTGLGTTRRKTRQCRHSWDKKELCCRRLRVLGSTRTQKTGQHDAGRSCGRQGREEELTDESVIWADFKRTEGRKQKIKRWGKGGGGVERVLGYDEEPSADDEEDGGERERDGAQA